VPSLGTSFGRGGATNFQQDLANSDCIVIMGSNMAECHPVGFQWVMEAKLHGATVIHIDPRFTRTSANASRYVPIRAGSDIAFLGGIVNYICENDKLFREYVVAYTNAATIISDDFKDTEDLDGLFSGWDAQRHSYDPSSWSYAELPKSRSPAKTSNQRTAILITMIGTFREMPWRPKTSGPSHFHRKRRAWALPFWKRVSP